MNITVGDLIAIRKDLESIFNQELPIKTSWNLSKIIKKIEEYYGDFETNRIKILKEYVSDGETKVPDDKIDEFSAKINELLNIEIDLGCDPISIDDLGDISVAPMALNKMSFLFSDGQK